MARTTRQSRGKRLTARALRRKRVEALLVLAAFVLVMVVALVVNVQLGTRLSERHAPGHHALQHLKLDLTLAHLWLEELLAGDEMADPDRIADLQASSQAALDTLVEETRNGTWPAEGSSSPATATDYVGLRDAVTELHRLADERRIQGASAAAGSAADARYNALFHDIMTTTNALEANAERAMDADLTHFKQLQFGLIAACLLLLGGGSWLISQQLTRLGTEVEQRRRSEQRLMASERAAVKARDAAHAANDAKNLLLAKVSHEIRTPVNAVVGLTAMLRDTPLTPRQRTYLDTGESEITGLLAIVDDLLDVSRASSGKMSLHPVALDLRALVAETVGSHMQQALEKGLDLDVVFAPDFPAAVVGDPVRLRQILSNLLRNAIKFTDSGSVLVELGGTTAPPGEPVEALIAVADTGPGIPPDQQQRIFEAFSQADDSMTRRHGGTGLGLAIVRELATLMGGEIELESRKAVGSRFTCRLPLRVAKAAMPHPPLPSGAPRRAWLLAPDDLIRARTLALLDREGVTCHCFATGHAALTTAEPAPDLWLVSDRLPDLTPGEMLTALRHRGAGPVWVVTTLERPREHAQLEAEGAAAVFGRAERALTLPRLLRGQSARASAIETPARRDSQPVHEDRAPGDAPTTDKPLFAGRVLVVEDHPVARMAAAHILERQGCEVDVACDGQEALAAWRQGEYALIFLDWQMPDLDGPQVATTIRREEAQSSRRPVRIVAMTANASRGDRDRCLAAGMDDYLPKPATPTDFRQALARAAPTGALA